MASRVIFPAQGILRGMSAGWGFTVLEYYVAAGLLTGCEIDEYLQSRGTLSSKSLEDLRNLVARLMALPEQKRPKAIDSFLATLSLLED